MRRVDPSSCPSELFARRLLISLTFGAVAACHAQPTLPVERPTLEATTVAREDVEVVREYVGQIRAIQHIEVRALESGYLRDTFVDEGQAVHRGDHLFQIMPVVYEAELSAASAEMRRATIEFRNTQMLADDDVVSPQALALAQASLDRSVALQSLARARLQFATLDAPFDGIVGRLLVRRGSVLEEGDVLTVLSDTSQMWVYFNISESAYLEYRTRHGTHDPVPVQLRLANGEMFSEPGVVQTIEADFNNQTGTIALRAGFPNPQRLLRHGETGKVLMTSVIPRALVIPLASTFHVLDKTYVYVVGSDQIVRAREITIGEQLARSVVVLDGVEEGEHVLIEGLRRVRDGDSIATVLRDAREVFASRESAPSRGQ